MNSRLADLSLNCVMRDSSPKLTVHSMIHASWLCSGTWLCTKTVATSGSRPMANSIAASSHRALADDAGLLRDRQGVEVDDAVERVDLVLAGDPVPQRAQVVAQMDVTGRLDAREHTGHGSEGTGRPVPERPGSVCAGTGSARFAVRVLAAMRGVGRCRALAAAVRAAPGAVQPSAARRRAWRAASCSTISSTLRAPDWKIGGGVDRQPAEAEVADLLGAGDDAVVVGVEVLAAAVVRRRRQHRLHPDGVGIAAGGLGVAADRGDRRPDVVVGAGDHAHPPVAELAGAAQRRRPAAADPDRQRRALRRLRLHGDGVGVERLALLLDALVAPARPQQPDRLVHLAPAAGEVLAERGVLGLLPADADAEAHAARPTACRAC